MFRHLLAVALLPVTVAVLVPFWIARRYGVAVTPGTSGTALLAPGAGLVVVAAGLALFLASLRQFVVVGRGTLAPWDPPRHLAIGGVYRFVRNPMIAGVIVILVGEALALRSGPHALWALGFLAINLVYVPLLEEPRLRRRFGDAYATYCRHVPRIVPRLRPWTPDRPGIDPP